MNTLALRPSLLHPADLSDGGEQSFVHALALALRSGYGLTLLHVQTPEETVIKMSGFQHAVDKLVAWRKLQVQPDAALLESQLGLRISSVSLPGRNVRDRVLDYLNDHPCELAVIRSPEHRGMSRWLDVSLGKRALRKASNMIVFLRDGARGFVDGAQGEIRLRRVLAPIDDKLDATQALARVSAWLARVSPKAEIHLLHVGERPPPAPRDADGAPFGPMILRQGPVAESIFEICRRASIDLVVMPTAGHTGFLGALRGSVTSRVLEDGRWPVLSVPVN